MSMPFRPQPKPSAKAKGKKSTSSTQKKRGDIGKNADGKLKDRSHGICELCGEAWAEQRAHLIGRRHIDHNTTEMDLLHLCDPCHDWLDETPKGIQARRAMAMLVNYTSEHFREIPGNSEKVRETKGTFGDG